MTPTLRHPHEILRRLRAGDYPVRRRNDAGRFEVRFPNGDAIADVALQTLLLSGEVRAERLTPDGEHARMVPAADPARPAEPVAAARATDPLTSKAAAAGVSVGASQAYVRALFQTFGPMTTAQLERVASTGMLSYSSSRLRSACAELERLGVLRRDGTVPTGHTTATGVATHATLWRLA